MQQESPDPIRVFIIDDHRSVLWGLQKLIESASPRMEVVGKATKWTEALAHVAQSRPDVILLDLDLGEETGLDAIPQFVSAGVGRVLVVTGMRDPSKQDSAVVLGARGVVEKEDSAEAILNAIGKVHEGQLWLPRLTIDRILSELSKKEMPRQPTPEERKIALLTPRERSIVEVIASNANANTKMIAARLFISEHTLRNHLSSIYVKLGVSTRLELFAFAHSNGLVPNKLC